MKTRGKPVQAEHHSSSTSFTEVLHSLESVLRTLRTLAQREDELCALLHEARTRGRLGVRGRRELAGLLQALPLAELQSEVDALQRRLG